MLKKYERTRQGKQMATKKAMGSSNTNKGNSTVKVILKALAPFIIFAVSLVLESCLVLGGDAGASGAMRTLFLGLFGYSAHVLFIGATVLAIFFADLEKRGTLRYKCIMLASLTVLGSSLLTLLGESGTDTTFAKIWTDGTLGQSGGLFGSIGILLSVMLSSTLAAVVCVIAMLLVATLTLGKTKLGIWRTVFHIAEKPVAPKKNAKKETKVKKDNERRAPALPQPDVSPTRVETMLGASEPTPYPELTAGVSTTEIGAGEFSVSDGRHTIETVNFDREEQTAKPFVPENLMEKLGLNQPTQVKTDIYSESSEEKPAPTPTKINLDHAYSPFTLPKAAQNAEPIVYGDDAGEAEAYSPFTNPVRSMKEPKRDNVGAALPVGDAATEQVWERMQKQAQGIDDESERTRERAPEGAPTMQNYAPVPPVHVESAEDYEIPEDNVDEGEANDEAAQVYTSVYDDNVEDVEEEDVDDVAEDDDYEYESVTESAPAQPLRPVYTPPVSESVPKDEDYEDDHAINPFSTYNKLRYPRFKFPSVELLDKADDSLGISENEIYETQKKLIDTLESFNISVTLAGYSKGPTITRYELNPGPGVKFKQIANLSEDISVRLQSEKLRSGIRVVTVPGKSVVGVEVPNSVVKKVALRTMIEESAFKNAKSKITACLGVDISGRSVYMNIDDMPHVLVAGQTKSGKSVAINCMIMSLIYRASPDEVQLILVDPKRVELSIYNNLPHLVMPVIDEPNKAAAALKWAVDEMDRRYKLLEEAQVRNRDEYYAYRDDNPNFEYMPQIVIIIDELADLMLQAKEHVEGRINRLAAMARACGMHLVIGTQRPSVDVVTGLIKANIPSQIAFKVALQTDSRVILGSGGAEKLLGRGDMLYHETGKDIVRLQGAFVDTPEIKRVLNYIIDNNGRAQYNPEVMYALQQETDKLNKAEKKVVQNDDYAVDGTDPDFDLLCQATELVIQMGGGISKNIIQRHLKVGFNRSANIFDKLVDLGFISQAQGNPNKPRDVLVTWEQYQQWKNNNGK